MANRLGWMVVALLFAGSVLNYIDRAALAVVKPLLQSDLGLTNTAYGIAVNSFLAAYTAFYILGGRLADRFGYERMFTVNVIFWSVACALHSLAAGLASLCLMRALLGVGEGGFYPAAMRGASEWFGPENRAKAVGILLCGLSIGSLLTPPLAAWVTVRWGWRATFLLVGLAGLLLIPPWMRLHRRLAALPRAVDPEHALPRETLPLARVLRHRKFIAFLLARAFTDVVWLFYLFWLPGYFQEVRGFDLASTGKLLWIPFLCSDVGALAGAWASSGLVQRGWSVNRSRKTVLLVSASLGVLGALAPAMPGSYAALAIVSVVLFGQLSWSSNIHTTITEIAPREHVAVLYGITGAAGNGLGALAQPLIGYVIDLSGYTPAFVATGCAYVLAIICILSAGPIQPLARKEHA
jgi:ACS family hexuronate transporter-like MFS transporter